MDLGANPQNMVWLEPAPVQPPTALIPLIYPHQLLAHPRLISASCRASPQTPLINIASLLVCVTGWIPDCDWGCKHTERGSLSRSPPHMMQSLHCSALSQRGEWQASAEWEGVRGLECTSVGEGVDCVLSVALPVIRGVIRPARLSDSFPSSSSAHWGLYGEWRVGMCVLGIRGSAGVTDPCE